MTPDFRSCAAVVVALAAALLLTPVVRAAARKVGLVSRPRADRWAKKPTALLGGIALFLAVLLAYAVLWPAEPQLQTVMIASALVFGVGLVDDLRRLKPYQKLIGQVMAASLVLLGGLILPWTSSALFNMAVTLLWLVGITNAINLLDNMDGLAAGVSAIASAFLAANFFANGQPQEAVLVIAFGAVLLGFLVYNFNPASIFMGDCGSLFLGFFLASTSLLHVSGGRSRGFLAVLAVPVLLLLIPIFDTTLVTVLRKLAGRAVSQGGRDHTSHRLVALGLSERWAVGLLYGLTLLSGLTAYCVRGLPTDVSLLLIVAFTLLLTLLGIHLAGVRVYEEGQESQAARQPLVGFLVDLSHKRRIFEVLLDVVLVGFAYYAANVLYYGPLREEDAQWMVVQALPLLVLIKLGTFLAVGLYRGLWRYIGLGDLVVFFRAVAASSAVCLLVFLFLYRFFGYSRVVFVLDALLLLVLLCASRMTFRVLRSVLPIGGASCGLRALIYGAGDGGEVLVREMRNNPRLGCVPVGFADDDPHKKGKRIHGLQVFGGNGSFLQICREQRVEVVLLSSTLFSEQRVQEIRRACEGEGIKLKRMRIVVEEVGSSSSLSLLEGDHE